MIGKGVGLLTGRMRRHFGLLNAVPESAPVAAYSHNRTISGDATDEYVDFGANYDYNHNEAFSVAFWVKCNGGGVPLISTLGSGTKGWTIESTSVNKITWGFWGTGTAQITTDSAIFSDGAYGNYYHVVCTKSTGSSASDFNIYVDGSLEAATANSDTLTATVSHGNLTWFKRPVGSVYATGYITECQIYNDELSASEVSDLFNSGTPPDPNTLGSSGGLQSWWNGKSDSNPTVTDKVGSVNGTMTNMEDADVVAVNVTNKCVYLDGTSDYADFGNNFQYERTQAFSASVWVKPTGTAAQTYFSNLDTSSGFRGWEFANAASGKPEFYLVNTWSSNALYMISTNTEMVADEWQNVIVTYDGSASASGVTMYRNGAVVTMTTTYDTLSATSVSPSTTRLGSRDNDTKELTGSFDQCAIWTKELSAAEVALVYNSGNPDLDLTTLGSASDLALYTKIGEDDTHPTLTDSSGNGIDGTLTGTTASRFRKDTGPT